MSRAFTPFHHPRRDCYWCRGGFQPLDTLTPHTTEHFCSSECALDSLNSRSLDPETRTRLKAEAVRVRSLKSTEVAQRLKEGRERARLQRITENDPQTLADLDPEEPSNPDIVGYV